MVCNSQLCYLLTNQIASFNSTITKNIIRNPKINSPVTGMVVFAPDLKTGYNASGLKYIHQVLQKILEELLNTLLYAR
jgi:hypothetical protein